MKTVEQIKEAILKHEAVIGYLSSQYTPFIQNLNIEHEYSDDRSYNVVDIFKNLTVNELNPDEMIIRNEIVERIEILNTSINNKVLISCQHNSNINEQIRTLKEQFKQEMSDVSEINLNSRMDITLKNVEKIDREHFIKAYLSLGVTHYNLNNDKHQIYYNPNERHFNTFKDDIFRSLPLNIQKKYPAFAAKIQNNKLYTAPASDSKLFEVIAARK